MTNTEKVIVRSDDSEDYELIGTIYSSSSKRFMRKPMKGLSRTLKSTNPDIAIVYKKRDSNIVDNTQENVAYKENDKVESIRIGGIFDTDKKHQAGAIWDKEGLAPTLDTMQGGWRQPSVTEEPLNTKKFRVRRLTPKECWRLMGIADEDYEKASKVVSNSQLYKQAGNAIVVNVLEGIFSNMPFEVQI